MLSLSATSMHPSLTTTVQYIAYKLGNPVYEKTSNMFDGPLASPALGIAFNSLVDKMENIPDWFNNHIFCDSSRVVIDYAFGSHMPYAESLILFKVLAPHIRSEPMTPLACVLIPGKSYWFVHYYDGETSDHTIIPFTDKLDATNDHDSAYLEIQKIIGAKDFTPIRVK